MPRWLVMWSLAVTIYAACKLITWWRTPVDAPLWKHAAYLFAWPGLDAYAFLATPPQRVVPPPPMREWLLASAKTAVGLAILRRGAAGA